MNTMGAASNPCTSRPASLFTDGENGPCMSVGAALAQPIFGSSRQGRDNIVVVDGIEATKLRPRRAKRRIGFVVDLGENPPGKLAILAGEPGLRLDKLEMRIELVREHGPAFGIERRREARLIFIKKPGEPAKREKVSQPLRWNDLDLVRRFRSIGLALFCRARAPCRGPGRIFEQSASRSLGGGTDAQPERGAAVSPPRSASGPELHAGLPASPTVPSHP